MRAIDADKFLAYLIFSKHIDGLTCGEVKEAIEMCKVDVFDKIRTELHATAEMHEDGDYYLRDEWIDEIIDKYKAESEEQGMSYCDTCIHHDVCGVEGVDDEATTYCADRIESCDEAISRQAVYEIINDIRDCISVEGYCAIIERMKKLPPVTPQPKTGHWTHDGSHWKNRFICSECGYKLFDEPTNYCPNCGRCMIEPQESEVKNEIV